MATWTSDELSAIGAAEELEIVSARRDGTLRNPVTIWVVRQGNHLYVRSVNGRTSSWSTGLSWVQPILSSWAVDDQQAKVTDFRIAAP